MSRILLLVALVAMATVVVAQPAGPSLTTTFTSNNGQSGNMFDVDSTQPLFITQFAINCDPGTYDVEVYVKTTGGSYLPDVNNPAAWTLVDLFQGVMSAGTDVPTLLPALSAPIGVTPGQLQGIYITLVNSTNINYTNGTTTGALFATDGVLNFYEGSGLSYPFSSNFNPRVWNGTIYYTTGALVPEYQTNQSGASLDFDGVQGSPFVPASTSTAFCDTWTVNLAALGSASTFDVGISLGQPLAAASSGSAIVTPGGQIFSLNLFGPTFTWLFGGSFTTPFFPQTITAGFPLGTPDVQAQMVVFDATSPETFYFSQPCDHATTGAGSFPALPAVDDGGLVIDLSTIACSPVSSVMMYGQMSSTVVAESNGRLSIGNAVDGDFSATVAEAQTDAPFIGYWTDLSPNASGTWAIGLNAATNELELTFSNVQYFGQTPPGSDNSFTIRYNAAQQWVLDGLQGILPSTTTAPDSFLGMSPGSLVGSATDPGAQAFSATGAGAATLATDMLYEFSTGVPQPASIASGLNTLTFTPDGAGNYVWFGM